MKLTEGGRVDDRVVDILSSVDQPFEAEPGIDTAVRAIVMAARDHIPGAGHAGVSLVSQGQIHTIAPSDDLVVEVDRLQYQADEGPNLDAMADHDTFRSDDLAVEQRWPRFAPLAARSGIHAMLSFRLFVTNTSLGALNLYSAQPHAFGTNAQTEGQLFASQAAVALLSAQHEAQLFGALESRDLIGMAKGILMQRHGIDADGAFRMLVEASQTSNIKLRHIAAWLVEHRDEI